MPFLVFTDGPNAGRRYKLGSGDHIIGRRSDCQIFVPDMRVSRQHARIRFEDKQWTIEDLGSNNGTYVNGHRVQSGVLRHRDEIQVASNTLVVELPEHLSTNRRVEADKFVTIVDLDNPLIHYASDDSDSYGRWSAQSVLAKAQDHDQQQRLLERKLAALTSILEVSARNTDPAQMLEALCEQLLEVFLDARSVGVLVEDEGGDLRVQAHHTRKKRKFPGSDLKVPGTIIEHVIKDRRGILLQETGVDLTQARRAETEFEGPAGSRMGAPIQVQDKSYGVIYMECESRQFRQDDVDLLATIAAQAGLAIHSARTQQDLRRQQRLEQDLRVARQIQRSLLPGQPPGVVGLDFAVHYEPAYQIGGDFYDFIWHDQERLAFMVGDVAGKAVSAALYMARLTSELRSRASIARTPAALLRRVNEEMLRLGDDGMFATLVYAVYDLTSRTLVFTNAGHMVPLLRRGGHVFPLESKRAHVAPLGVIAGMEIAEAKVQLQTGDLVVLSTDGIHEARDATGNEYGTRRLVRRIETARGGPDDVVKAILQDVDSHVAQGSQVDDMTILAMQVVRARARRQSTLPADLHEEVTHGED